MRLDENFDPLDPLIVRERLRKLGQFTGYDGDGGRFTATVAFAVDPFGMMKVWHWRHAYIGRYGHQQIAALADVPVAELWAFIEALSDLLKNESPLKGTE